jgi:UDP-glucose 4-epimerase
MKALVVGGNGFIGSHLVDSLVKAGWQVNVLDIHERRYDSIPSSVHFVYGDLNQDYLVREVLVGVRVVFHLAWSTIHEISIQDPAADIRANLIPSINLIEACQQADVQRIVFVSSGGTVYGPAQEIPISEIHPTNPVSGYGITKLAVEKYLQMFNHLNGLDYVILRPSVPYGPRQNPLGRQGVVAVFLYRVAHSLPIQIWGNGAITRDYFHISDLIRALMVSAEKDLQEHRIFNIGGQKEISLIQLLDHIQETVGIKARVSFEPARGFDAPRVLLDTSRANQILNWYPEVTIEQGLAQTWSWVRTISE